MFAFNLQQDTLMNDAQVYGMDVIRKHLVASGFARESSDGGVLERKPRRFSSHSWPAWGLYWPLKKTWGLVARSAPASRRPSVGQRSAQECPLKAGNKSDASTREIVRTVDLNKLSRCTTANRVSHFEGTARSYIDHCAI